MHFRIGRSASGHIGIADANRRALLDLVAARESTVGELVNGVGLSYSAVSQHLAILRKAGLVRCDTRGRERVYRFTPMSLRDVHAWTSRYEEFWRSRLARLRSVLQEKKR